MSVRLNSKGAGMLPIVLGISVLSVVGVGAISQLGLDSMRRSSRAYSEWETNLSNQMVLSLGGYFVAHNLVLCREDGWTDMSDKNAKCRWGGSYHMPEIKSSSYNVKKIVYEDSVLALTIELKPDDSADGKPVTTQLKMDLVNWGKNAAMRDLIGEIPNVNSVVDDDQFVVLMTATTELQQGDQIKNVVKTGALRRPIAGPSVQVRNTGRESCIFECHAGTGDNILTPYPECRGALGAPTNGESTAMFGIRIANAGPGAIYKLAYERTTHFNQTSYPGRASETSQIDVLTSQDVLMPGESIEKEIERKCYPPIQVTNTISPRTSINSIFSDTNTTQAGTVSVVSSFRALSSESFDLVASVYDPAQITNPNFFETYKRYLSGTFIPYEGGSKLEPKRMANGPAAFEVAGTQETRVTVRPRPTVRQGDGDGDGDN